MRRSVGLAREHWLEYREQQAGMGMDMGQKKGAEVTPDRKKEHELPDDDFAL